MLDAVPHTHVLRCDSGGWGLRAYFDVLLLPHFIQAVSRKRDMMVLLAFQIGGDTLDHCYTEVISNAALRTNGIR